MSGHISSDHEQKLSVTNFQSETNIAKGAYRVKDVFDLTSCLPVILRERVAKTSADLGLGERSSTGANTLQLAPPTFGAMQELLPVPLTQTLVLEPTGLPTGQLEEGSVTF